MEIVFSFSQVKFQRSWLYACIREQLRLKKKLFFQEFKGRIVDFFFFFYLVIWIKTGIIHKQRCLLLLFFYPNLPPLLAFIFYWIVSFSKSSQTTPTLTWDVVYGWSLNLKKKICIYVLKALVRNIWFKFSSQSCKISSHQRNCHRKKELSNSIIAILNFYKNILVQKSHLVKLLLWSILTFKLLIFCKIAQFLFFVSGHNGCFWEVLSKKYFRQISIFGTNK